MQKNYTFRHVRSIAKHQDVEKLENELPNEYTIQQILRYAKAIEFKKTKNEQVFHWMLN